MNEFISPNQNININISYNLNQQQKIPKIVLGKKIHKNSKTYHKEYTDIFEKTMKKNYQYNNMQDEIKKEKNSKSIKMKKKTNNIITLTEQEIPIPRRLKTEGNVAFKKQPKTHTKSVLQKPATQHSKNFNNPLSFSSQNPKTLQMKKSSNKMKKQKEERRNYNKSCILYQPKKHILLSDIEHIVSTTTNGPTPTNKQQNHNKKRVNSVNLMRGDKFINKLLDMSVLTSQLGGTVPMNQESNTNIRQQSRQNTGNNRNKTALQDFMNSIDLRIIKKMEQDNKNKKGLFKDSFIESQIELITYLTKIKRIPIERLNEKATKIQRFWRRKASQTVIPYYSNMFFRNPAINSKVAIQNNLQDISDINIRVGQIENLAQISDCPESLMRSSIGKYKEEKGELVQCVRMESNYNESCGKMNKIIEFRSDIRVNYKKGHQVLSQKDEQLQDEEQRIQIYVQKSEEQIQYREQQSLDYEEQYENSQNSKSLNIQKYKQLVKQSIEKNKQSQQKISTIIYKEHKNSAQSAHWNHVHNILSTNMNKKAPLIPKNVLEELMKQSAYNKQWVEGEFSNSESRKISQKSSPREIHESDTGILMVEKQKHLNRSTKDNRNNYELSKQELDQFPSPHKYERKVSQQDNYYNSNKYSDISRLKKPQQIPNKNDQITYKHHISIQHGHNYEHNKGNQMLDNMQDIYNSSSDKDIKWIREQMMMENQIVEKYLDCGLDNFGLRLSQNQQVDIRSENLGISDKREIEWQQEKQVQQKEQHRAKLQKQPHRTPPKAQDQIKIIKQPESEQVDIFSSQQPSNNHDQDQQLVYVFQNINNKGIDIDKLFLNNANREDINQFVEVVNEEKAKKFPAFEEQSSELPTGFKNKQYRQFIPPSNLSQQKQSQQIPLFEPSEKTDQPISLNPLQTIPQGSVQFSRQEQVLKEEIKNKKIQKLTQTLIAKLIQEFAYDVSAILRKSQSQGNSLSSSSKNSKIEFKNNIRTPNSVHAFLSIQTNFQNIRDFITKLKQFILNDQQYSKKIIQHLRNNIGPTSLQILSYLRIQEPSQEGEGDGYIEEQEEQNNEEWLFVIPNDLFEVFHKKLLDEEEATRNKKLPNKFKLYTEFWHRSIFQCYNQCLDFQRPFGIVGTPYAWVTEPKLPRQIKYSKQKVQQVLENAEGRLLQISCSSAGLIFDKPQSPYRQFDLSEQSKIQLNEQKISRMLANQILDDEYNWVTYNDEVTELMVDIGRKIQELLIFQVSTDVKRIVRRRKMILNLSKCEDINGQECREEEDQHVFLMTEYAT